MKNYLKFAGLLSMVLFLFVSCEKETPPPTASFTYAVDGNKVTFTAEATDYNKFEWDFGDGSYINTIPSPVHAYSSYGKDYTVTLTVIGEGGQVSVTNTVTIPPKTKMQLLTGGTTASSSKKWRLNVNAPEFIINLATPDFKPNYKTYPGNILAAVGLSQVYGDTFEFKGDGKLIIHPNGGGIFAGYVYCLLTGTPNIGNAGGSGLSYAKPFTAPANATFQINEGKNFTITTSPDSKNTMEITYQNVMTLSFTNGGFFGILDSTSECIIQELTDTKIVAVLFVSTVAPPGPVGKPNLVLNVTFEVAP